jgi:phosphatidate cytidylyltransferase
MTRVLSGVVLAAAFFTVVWFGTTTALLGVAMVVCFLAFREYAVLMETLHAGPPRLLALAATLAMLVSVPMAQVPMALVLSLGLITMAVAAMFRLAPDPAVDAAAAVGPGFGPAIHSTASGVFAVLYLGLPLGALVAVHQLGGREAVVLLVATVALSDTAQYYAGRAFGRRPLAPALSPKKTIEGAIGGVVAAPIFLFAMGPALVPRAQPLGAAAVGVALVAAGIAGDLFESMLKRAANMKDSGSLIPGHGGVLDRIDALLFATPIFYLYLRWLEAA